MLQSVLLILGLAALAPLVHRLSGRWSGWLLGFISAGVFTYFALSFGDIVGGSVFSQRWEWIPSLGAAISFRLDGLSLAFAMLVTGAGALILIYAGAYLKGHERLGEFYGTLLLFEASMLGLVLADNIVCLFVFWELTSVSSFMLIGFERQRESARRAALQALVVTGLGGMALLGGLVMLGVAAGSWELSEIVRSGDAVVAHDLFVPALALICLGAFTKSAQFPFHFWLPNAMEAPTPVSAYLHSATMVKAGVYLLARLNPAMSGGEAWGLTLTIVGGVTFAIGALLATRATELKRILAYTTVSGLGGLVGMLGIGGEVAIVGMAVFLITHALYKGCLFLVAGIVDHETGEKRTDHLGGLFGRMPLTATASILAALSMAGVPALIGFIGKEHTIEAALHSERGWWVVALAVAGSLLTVAGAGMAGVTPFVGAKRDTPREGHDPGPAMLLGPVVLGVLGLALGVAPGFFLDGFVSAIASAVTGERVDGHLKFWHGFTVVLGISAGALMVGALIWLFAGAWRRLLSPLHALSRVGPEAIYETSLAVLVVVAGAVTRFIQNGRLRWYLMAVFLFTAAVAGAAAFRAGSLRPLGPIGDVPVFDTIVCLLIMVGAIATTRAKGRLGAVASLGIVGYGVTVIFVLYGAPDLALTQIAVETLTVILFVLVLYHLPRFAVYTSRAARARDLVIAGGFGALMTSLTLLAADAQIAPKISDWFVEQSMPKGKGHNIVNVILVDFRALDTMGEITVLGVAAIGVAALLKLRPARRAESEP